MGEGKIRNSSKQTRSFHAHSFPRYTISFSIRIFFTRILRLKFTNILRINLRFLKEHNWGYWKVVNTIQLRYDLTKPRVDFTLSLNGTTSQNTTTALAICSILITFLQEVQYCIRFHCLQSGSTIASLLIQECKITVVPLKFPSSFSPLFRVECKHKYSPVDSSSHEIEWQFGFVTF